MTHTYFLIDESVDYVTQRRWLHYDVTDNINFTFLHISSAHRKCRLILPVNPSSMQPKNKNIRSRPATMQQQLPARQKTFVST
jgi:hypothetical protein